MEHCETFENFWSLPHLALSGVPCVPCEAGGTADLCWLSLVTALSLQICIFPPSNAPSEAFKPIKRKLKWPSRLISTFELGAA